MGTESPWSWPRREPGPLKPSTTDTALLSVESVSIRFGGVTALEDVTFRVAPGAICGLIGPNGAGKTTLFNCISRLYDPHAGSIRFDGRPLSGVPRHEIAPLGIARTFQNVALFATMSTRDNVRVGAHALARGGFLVNALALPLAAREERRIAERAEALIEEFGLERVADRPVGELPFGLRKRVELARALAIEPKLLLLDEPAAGLNHEEVDALGDEIRAIRDRRGVAILLVEHHMNLVMRVSDQVVALDFGRIIADGRPDEVRANPNVVRAYLGAARVSGPILEAKGLTAFYGSIQALFGLDFNVEDGGVTALLGANGAGKTTTLRALSGLIRREGDIRLRGKPIGALPTETIARLGVAHVPDGRGTFTDLTVEENLRLGAYVRSDRAGVRRDFDRVFAYFPRLAERRRQQAGTLSGGEQQMLAISRALLMRPSLLMLDEPSFGLAPLVVAEIFRILAAINRDEGVSMLIVEQNASLALDLADRAVLIETGTRGDERSVAGASRRRRGAPRLSRLLRCAA